MQSQPVSAGEVPVVRLVRGACEAAAGAGKVSFEQVPKGPDAVLLWGWARQEGSPALKNCSPRQGKKVFVPFGKNLC